MSLGSKIKEVRELFGMTQKDLAEKSGISRVSIGNYERDSRIPNSTVLKKIATALHTNPDYLLEVNPYFDSDIQTSEIYDKYLPNFDFDFLLEEYLEKHDYIIEPSIYDFSNEEEQKIRVDEWTNPDKQYFNLIHNGNKLKIPPKEVVTFEQNIIKAIEFEWYKLVQKYGK